MNPLDNMFEPAASRPAVNDTGSSTRNDGELSRGTIDVGAEAHAGTSTSTTTSNGNTTTTKDVSKEAHAGVAIRADASQGQLATSLEAGASLHAKQNGSKSSETEIGPATLRGQLEGQVEVNAEAGVRSRNEIDLSRGSVDLENRAAVGVDFNLSGRAGGELQVGDTTVSRGVSASTSGAARAHAENRFTANEEGLSSSGSLGAEARLAADVSTDMGIRNEDGSGINASARGEASVYAEAHASSNFTSTQDELSFGTSLGASAGAQLMAEGTVSGQTANGSSFSLNGGANTGSLGAGIEGGFSRKDGRTSISLGSSGKAALIGGHLNGQVTIADRDIGEAAAAPLHGVANVSNAVGGVAESAGQYTESARQSANQRQQVLDQMAAYPTGSFVTDVGNDVAAGAHGLYTGAVNTADTVVDATAGFANAAGETIGNAAETVADGVEYAVGSTLNAGVRGVNNAYQAARSFGSWINPFD